MPVVLWLLWIVCGLLLHVMVQSGYTLALVAVSIAIPLVTAALAVVPAKRLAVCLDLPDSITKHEPCGIKIHVTNSAVIPIVFAKLCLTVTNRLTGESDAAVLSFSVGSKRRKSLDFTLKSVYCGQLSVSVTRVRVYDCFGILPVKSGCAEHSTVTVMPETFIPALNLPVQTGIVQDSESYSADKPGFDYAETFQIREYAEGDSRKQIHWKLTTKLDKLVVREPGLPLERSVLLIWERQVSGADGETPAQSDAMAEILISLCRELIRQEVMCKIAWNDAQSGECRCYEIREEPDFYAALPDFLSARAGFGIGSAAEAYLRLYGRAASGKVVYLSTYITPLVDELAGAGSPTVLLCGGEDGDYGGRIYTFSDGNYREALFEIDLF